MTHKSVPRTCYTQIAIIEAIRIWSREWELRRKGRVMEITPLPELAEIAMERAARVLIGPMVEIEEDPNER